MEVPGIGATPRGIIGTKMTGASILESAALGGVDLALESSGAMHPKLPGLYLPGSSDSASPPIYWRRVENEAELACSQVTTTEQLPHLTLASVHRNIFRPV
jgi:hypothetical protein